MNENMDPEDAAVLRRLEALAEAQVPPSGVSVDRALTDGRRTRRNRTVGMAAWSTAAVLVATGGAAVAVAHAGGGNKATYTAAGPSGTGAAPGSRSCGAAGGSGGTGSTALPMPTSTVVPMTSTDPFGVGAKFGWLPSGADHIGVTNGPAGALNAVARGAAGANANTPFLWLQTFPQCMTEKQVFTELRAGSPGGSQTSISPIDGKPAYQVNGMATGSPDPGAGEIIWQMSNGQWAYLDGYNLVSDAMTKLRHVAETATPDSSPPPLPLRISGLPKDITAEYYNFDRPSYTGPGAFDFSVAFNVGDGDLVTYAVAPAGTANLGNQGDQCKTANGLEVCVGDLNGQLPPSIHGGVKGLLDDVTLMSADPSTWTTDVLELN